MWSLPVLAENFLFAIAASLFCDGWAGSLTKIECILNKQCQVLSYFWKTTKILGRKRHRKCLSICWYIFILKKTSYYEGNIISRWITSWLGVGLWVFGESILCRYTCC